DVTTLLVVIAFILFNDMLFFFSSRRRHTISLRDWSSDVCSSDLTRSSAATSTPCLTAKPVAAGVGVPSGLNDAETGGPLTSSSRSEERRVGKERRSPRAADH